MGVTMRPASMEFEPHEEWALQLDEQDELSSCRARFRIPVGSSDARPAVYLCGHSLGLQPEGAAALVERELEEWARKGVDAHFKEDSPWYSYHEMFRESGARLVGARPGEVVMMNGLTVNLHLMLTSFYRPTPERHAILMEDCAFPSASYAVRSQIRLHGLDPADSLWTIRPHSGKSAIATEQFEELIEQRGEEIALVLLGGVNYFTGQLFDMERIARAARAKGCVVGYDLAHAAGNVPLQLHDWGVHFADWCSYKYLKAGPGAVAGCFVHQRHARDPELKRFAGWWGNDPGRRFRMHLEGQFVPVPGADGWQVSNPPVLAMAPLRASMEIFDEVGMQALRVKSLRLTRYLEQWVERAGADRVELLTPRDPGRRGCQLSLRALGSSADRFRSLRAAGIIGDFREPDVIRVAPVPL